MIFHGYLLRGTGSNVYNAALSEALARNGHEVHLLCQERDPLSLAWVDAAGDWDGGVLRVEQRREPAQVTVYRPPIDLLPVYVADRYEGVEARPLPDLTDAEVDEYVARNVAAVREVAARVAPAVALANHLVMGPLVLARALAGTDVPYAVKIHGSALEYVVKPHPRFLPAALEGIRSARGVLTGSRHTAESLWAALDEPGLPEKTRLGPPGVDVERFAPRDPGAAAAGWAALRQRLAADAPGGEAGAPSSPAAPGGQSAASSPVADSTASSPAATGAGAGSSFAVTAGEAARALGAIDPTRHRVVVFVGKLIASKGVDLLLGAWPLVLERVPDARLLIVGFGAFRSGLQELAQALGRGDLAAARRLRAEDGRPLPELGAFLDGLRGEAAAAYREAAADLPGRVQWAGRLEHAELADVLPAAEAMAVPSTFPEAFGMVAAEAAACGALPIVARHSGLAEVARSLAAEVPASVRPWLTFAVGSDAVSQLGTALADWLTAPGPIRAATREAIVDVVRARYSWDGVARTMLAAAQGDLEGLSPP
jgi:glycosyltransferase involved in cell wall biosynthesis